MTAKRAQAAWQSNAKGRADCGRFMPDRGPFPSKHWLQMRDTPPNVLSLAMTLDGRLSADSPVRSAGLLTCQEHLARTIAAGMGPESSAAKALEELDERRARGERVFVVPKRGQWVVEPI